MAPGMKWFPKPRDRRLQVPHWGRERAARRVESAIQAVTATKMKSMSAGKMGYSTTEVGDLVVRALGRA